MKILELFCGTKCISSAFAKRGHETFTVDWEKSFEPSLCVDIGKLTVDDILTLCNGKPNVIWASPDCTSYSVAGIWRHRTVNDDGMLVPKSEYARFCDEVNRHVISLIREVSPDLWFIENPRAGMRKADFMNDLNKYRYTVTYCQYGDFRMKPTDIWTNHPNPDFKQMCKCGDSCHVSSPRGSYTGTQGIVKRIDRSRIPEQLCKHIVDICEKVVL